MQRGGSSFIKPVIHTCFHLFTCTAARALLFNIFLPIFAFFIRKNCNAETALMSYRLYVSVIAFLLINIVIWRQLWQQIRSVVHIYFYSSVCKNWNARVAEIWSAEYICNWYLFFHPKYKAGYISKVLPIVSTCFLTPNMKRDIYLPPISIYPKKIWDVEIWPAVDTCFPI